MGRLDAGETCLEDVALGYIAISAQPGERWCYFKL